MRPGQQQNKQRMRGRGRKGPNPMSRSFESNGPDVKIRGTAQHIADKYTTLARDASASGDRVMAENYLQHAEHYGRIVAAAQGQFQPSQPERDFDDMEDDVDDGAGGDFAGQQPYAGDRGNNGQGGYQNGDRPSQGYRDNNQQRDNNQPRDQQPRDRDNNPARDRGDSGPRDSRDNQPRGDRNERREFRENRGDRPYQNRDNAPRDGQNRDGGNRDGQRDNRDFNGARAERDNSQPRDQRERTGQNGSGPQPFVRDDVDGQATQPVRTDGNREGGRREGRRERPRLNERSGERRFEDRFSRPRSDEGDGDDAAPVTNDAAVSPAPQPVIDTTQPEIKPVVETMREANALDVAAPSSGPQAGEALEPRRRGRPRRERMEGTVAAEATSAPAIDAPASVSASADASEPAPAAATRRRPAKTAAPEAAVADAPTPDAAEAPAKRRPGRPRKKKPGEEGGDGDDEPHLPAFLLASNG